MPAHVLHDAQPCMINSGMQRAAGSTSRTFSFRMSTHYGAVHDEYEEYEEYEDKPASLRTKVVWGVVGSAVVAVLFYFMAVWLPEQMIPEARVLAQFDKVGTLGVTLQPAAPTLAVEVAGKKTSRIVLVGDVHGEYGALQKLLKKIKYHRRRDTVVLLGDFILKGPDLFKVLEWAIENEAACILGNHEMYVLGLYAQYHRIDGPEFAGDVTPVAALAGGAVLVSGLADDPEFQIARKLEPRHVEYINNCPLILELGPVAVRKHPKAAEPEFRAQPAAGVAVHGGLNPGVERLADQVPEDVLNMRSLLPPFFNETTEDHGNGAVPWLKVWNEKQRALGKKHQQVVFYGHDARRGMVYKKFSHGLDSRCTMGGELSAAVVYAEEEAGTVVYKDHVYQVLC